MTFELDPQVAAALATVVAMQDGVVRPPVGDWRARRENVEALLRAFAAKRDQHPEVGRRTVQIEAGDGAMITARWYSPPDPAGGPAALYLHGGGMIFGSVELSDTIVADYVAASGVPMLSVDYRLAPEHPHPTPVEDCYAALRWLADRAPELGVDPARIAVMGDSAGGGLAAGVTMLARDRGGPAVCRQLLVYPMLDDRTSKVDEHIAPFLLWTYDDNVTGWRALLGPAAGGEHVSAYAAPARATDLSGLPPAYIDVGQLDIFRDEDLDYARRLSAAGVPVEFHLYPGCPHGFESFALSAEVSALALANRVRALRQV